MSGLLFDGIKQWEFERKGIKGKLPVFYYDNTSLTGIYTAATERVKDLLPYPGMRPIELYPGRCLAAFTAFEYRRTDIGPYNEFSIAFLMTLKKVQVLGFTPFWQMARRHFTAYVWQLPVTTEVARVGGVELYGYPKFVAEIRFEKGRDWIRCDLSEEGEKILTLRGKVLPTKRGKLTRFVTYSVVDGIPLVANVLVDPIEFAQSREKSAVALEFGTGHPICDALGKIELSKTPLVYQFSPVTEAILFGGRNLVDN